MSSTLDYTTFDNLIGAVLTASAPRTKQAAVGEALTYLIETKVIEVWAESISNTFGYRDWLGKEDIRSVIIEKILITLRAATEAESRRVKSWVDFLFGLSKNAVRDYLGSGQVTVASGMSNVARRQASIGIARRDLVTRMGREPSQQEIIEFANAHMLATRKDPKKQGILLTSADFVNTSASSVPADEMLDLAATRHTTASIEEKVEASLAAQKLLRAATESFPDDEELPKVVRQWVRLQLEGERASVMAIANATGLARGVVKLSLTHLTDVLEEMRAAA